MRAVRKLEKGIGHLALQDIPEPVVRPGCFKMKVEYAGICGSDLHFVREGLDTKGGIPWPLTLGHEYSGTIVELGEGCTQFKVGDRVVAASITGWCGKCPACLGVGVGYCKDTKPLGWGAEGAMTEYVVHEEMYAYKLPDNIPFDEAALIEPLAISLSAVYEVANICPTDTVVIFGAGTVGLTVLQFVKLAGATAYVVDVSKARQKLELAKKFGADEIFENDKCDAVAEILKLNGGRLVDAIFECSSYYPCADQGIDLLKSRGTIYLVGAPDVNIGYQFKNGSPAMMKRHNFQVSYGFSPHTWPKVIRLMEQGRLNVKDLITHVFPLEDYEEAFWLKDPNAIKILFKP